MEANKIDLNNLTIVLKRIHSQATAENVRITQHAQQEMVEEDISLDEVLESITTGQILENYPDYEPKRPKW